MPVDEAYIRLGSRPAGLTAEEAETSREKYGENVLPAGKKHTLAARIFGAFVNPFTVILLVLAAVSVLTDIVFAGTKVFCRYDAKIGGDHVARGEVNDVTHRQFRHGDFLFSFAQTGDASRRRDHGGEFFSRGAAARFLHKAQYAGHDDHDRNYGDSDVIASFSSIH